MYLSRTGSFLDLLAWMVLFVLSWACGWMLCEFLFKLRKREIPLVGMGVGFFLFVLLSNFLAYVIPLPLAYWATAIALCLIGILAGWRVRFQSRIKLKELAGYWKQAVAFSLLMLLFALIMRGLTIFDESSNLPLVGTLASGEFPARFYLDSEIPLYYHYGLHLFAASLVQVGGLTVWSAFDISRVLTIVLTLLYCWLWVRRYSPNCFFWAFSLSLVLFASGARWLLLFLPQGALEYISSSITMLRSASESAETFSQALVSSWNIESGSPIPFSFAFANGILSPLSMALGGSGATPQMALFLLLLLSRRRWSFSTGLLYGSLLASLRIFGEYFLIMALVGMILAVVISFLRNPAEKNSRRWVWVFLPSAIFVPIMGGVLTGISRSMVANVTGAAHNNLTFTGVSLRWPPAFTSSHLGSLSIFNLNQLSVSLAEIGVVLVVAPITIWMILTSIRSHKLALAGLGIGSWIGVAAPIFLRLSFSDRDVSYIIGMGLFTWLVISLPWWWIYLRNNPRRWYLGFGFWALAVLGGLAIFIPQLVAVQKTNYTYFIDEPDARMSRLHWREIQGNARMLDLSNPSRPGTLFGLSIGHAYQNIDTPFPEYAALHNNPDPGLVSEAGYSYIYIDREAWQKLSNLQKNAFERSCVRRIAEYRSVTNDFRRLYDIRQCAK